MGEKKRTRGKQHGNETLDRFFITKVWKSNKHSLYSQDEIEHRIYNDLPLDDIFDRSLNTYNRTEKSKKTDREPGSKPLGRPKNKNNNENM